MRKTFPILVAAALALSGCAGGLTSLETDVKSVAATITDPQVQAAAATIKSGAGIFICGVAEAQSFASALEPAFNAGQSIAGTGSKVLTVSTAVCGKLTGTVVGTTTAVPGLAVATSATSVATVQ